MKPRRCPMEKRGRYSKEFKQEAIRLLNEGDKPASEIAMQLGVKRTLLYRWRDELNKKGEKAFSNRPGRPTLEEESELTRLRRENRELKEDRDILKKAAAYFARDLK
jgi:transposase